MELENNPKYLISCDFGQMNDYTAVAVTERRIIPTGEPYEHAFYDYSGMNPVRRTEVRQDVEQRYDLIRLDRVPLRTPYTKIAGGIVTLLKELHRKHGDDLGPVGIGEAAVRHPRDHKKPITVGLAIDEGGVGKAVRDILVKEMMESIEKDRPKVRFVPVTVHGGANTTRDGGFYHVPKRDLVFAGVIAYQNERLRVGALEHRATLEGELASFRLKQNISTGNVAFEPLRENEHDDLLFAVCLGCWAWEYAIKKIKYTSKPNAILTGIPPHKMAQYG